MALPRQRMGGSGSGSGVGPASDTCASAVAFLKSERKPMRREESARGGCIPVPFPVQCAESAMTTANKITLTRIFLIPVFVMMAIYYGRGVQHGHPVQWQR